ncbi:MAG: ABC transporter permease [Armatimonadetes bacterium]|nr:ABC transporter permease [Armatimonadota bacterium]
MREGSMLKRAAAFAVRYRIVLLLAAIWAFMTATAPNFATTGNFASILRASATHLPAAIGLTLVMSAGHLDLSFGSGMSWAGMIAIGLQPRLGWSGAIGAALASGVVLGLLNGALVAKARVNSFIATLGTLTVVQGMVNIVSKGGTLAVQDFAAGDWLEGAILGMLCPRVIACLALVVVAEAALKRTRPGRNLLLVGANPITAWYAGIPISTYVVGVFALSGLFSSANPLMGESSLMLVIAAVIIGGTSMQGGRGSVVQTLVAVVALVSLTNGLSCMGAPHETQLIAGGLVLGASVLYDAWLARGAALRKGRRLALMSESVSRSEG